MSVKSMGVTDVTDHPLITVTRARTRACDAYTELSVTSVTPVTPVTAAGSHPAASDALAHAILALDLGTQTGWALRAAEGAHSSGTVSFRPSRYDGGGMRYLRFTNWLTELDEQKGPLSAIYFEAVRRHAGTDAAHVYGGLMATLTAWAELRGVPYEGIPVGTIKRFATGKGNASKAAVIQAMRERGFAPSDDNEADALALLLWAVETTGGVR